MEANKTMGCVIVKKFRMILISYFACLSSTRIEFSISG